MTWEQEQTCRQAQTAAPRDCRILPTRPVQAAHKLFVLLPGTLVLPRRVSDRCVCSHCPCMASWRSLEGEEVAQLRDLHSEVQVKAGGHKLPAHILEPACTQAVRPLESQTYSLLQG